MIPRFFWNDVEKNTYSVYFAEANGLFVGDEVRILGVAVGVVGGRALLRFSDLNVTEYHTLASLGIPMHVVGYNANPCECLDFVKAMNCPTVKGNHDEEATQDRTMDELNPLAESAISCTTSPSTRRRAPRASSRL